MTEPNKIIISGDVFYVIALDVQKIAQSQYNKDQGRIGLWVFVTAAQMFGFCFLLKSGT